MVFIIIKGFFCEINFILQRPTVLGFHDLPLMLLCKSVIFITGITSFTKSKGIYLKILNIGTPEMITIIVLQMEQLDFTVQ